MNIVKVSMVGANEYLPEKDVIEFIRAYPKAEIGIGVSAEKSGYGTPRLRYVKSLQKLLGAECCRLAQNIGTIALHVNGSGKDGEYGWPYRISNGIVDSAIEKMLDFPHNSPHMSMQINHFGYDIPAENAKNFVYSRDLWRIITPRTRLILSYSDKSKEYVKTFYDTLCELRKSSVDRYSALNLDILYDTSFGNGKIANNYAAPLYPELRQGYAGGLGPDNINDELVKIQKACSGHNPEIWIDAESKLKTDNGKTLDLNKATVFYEKIMSFMAR